MTYASEYNKPVALLPKKNVYAPTIAVKIALMNEPILPIPLKSPAIQLKISAIIATMIITINTLKIPIAFKSLIAAPIFKASPNDPVFANLHSPMIRANPNMMNKIKPTIKPKVSFIEDNNPITMSGMIKYTIPTIKYLRPAITCLAISISGAASLLSIPNFKKFCINMLIKLIFYFFNA